MAATDKGCEEEGMLSPLPSLLPLSTTIDPSSPMEKPGDADWLGTACKTRRGRTR
jgi:hypothetical protein